MKKGFKRAISLILCLAMLAGATAVTCYAAEDKCNCGHCPLIVLPGINHSPTYLYDENYQPVPDKFDKDGAQIGGTLLILNMEDLLKCIPKVLFSLLATIATQHNILLDKVAYETAAAAFSIQKCDDNGNYVNNLKTQRWNYPLSQMTEDEVNWVYRMVPMQRIVDIIRPNHTYFYTFNLVGDPMQSAKELDEYIDMVKRQTGHDKVDLLPVSLGGTILTAYLDAYGHKDINSIVGVVACLNGTDIVADLMARDFNISDEYLHHEYIPTILKESNGRGTLGYLINCILHILPQAGFNALLTGAMSGLLDTMVLNCPQMWAMVPSYRYDALASRYLSAKPVLKAKTDRFQQARLNLKQNILDAVADGVKVNFISGSGLAFGEEMYTFFSIMSSSGKVNSDGIINLSSTALGTTGTVGGATIAKQAHDNPAYPGYSYLSPDGTIDISTAVLPDNTWVFLKQYHEVGNNDVVLNLAKALLLGEIENVHSNPAKYPQYNYFCNTKTLRRWRINDGKEALKKTDLSEEDRAEIVAAIAQAEAVLEMTVADQSAVEAAQARLDTILYKVGQLTPPKEESKLAPGLEKFFESMSWMLYKTLGGGSVYDKIFH